MTYAENNDANMLLHLANADPAAAEIHRIYSDPTKNAINEAPEVPAPPLPLNSCVCCSAAVSTPLCSVAMSKLSFERTLRNQLLSAVRKNYL